MGESRGDDAAAKDLVSTSFSEEKEAKRLLYAGAWALKPIQPMSQRTASSGLL
jgi:hypothetical protein